MPGSTYLSPKTVKYTSSVHGVGLFAREPIRRHEVIAVKGGHVMTPAEWARLEPLVGEAAEIHVATDLVIAPRSKTEYEGSMMHLNHSCEPNVGVEGQIVFVALRDVAAGEELLLDYAMMDDHDERMACSCRSATCRGVITGHDWELPELQRKYEGYFSSYLERRIAEKRSRGEQ
jgi:SET domain-containing protein